MQLLSVPRVDAQREPGPAELPGDQALRARRAAVAGTARSLAFLGADVAACLLAAVLALGMETGLGRGPAAAGSALLDGSSAVATVLLLAFLAGRGHYARRMPLWAGLPAVIAGAAGAMLLDGFVTATIEGAPLRLEDVARWALLPPAVVATRCLARAGLRAAGLWTLPTLIVGGFPASEEARRALRSEPGLGYEVAGVVDAGELAADGHLDGPAALAALVKRRGVDFVVVATGAPASEAEMRTISELSCSRVPFALMPLVERVSVLGFSQQYFLSHNTVLLVCRDSLASPFGRAAKRALDVAVALALLLLLAPLLVVLALLVRQDGGPVLYGHRRIGLGGQAFACLKFRTMVTDADAVLRRVLDADPDARREWEERHKLRDDPRVTGIGRFLRRTSLDELPQLFNVLRGEMSLVGPRPIVEAEIRRYGAEIAHYYQARPGITGLWQVSGRSNTSYDDRVKLDSWYVKNWTLWHDLVILMRTVPAVLSRTGAV